MLQHFASIPDAIQDFKDGKFLIIMDDENRENEGDLVIAAEHITQEKMHFLVKVTTGIVCVPLIDNVLKNLNLPLMTNDENDKFKTAFTISCDYAIGTTTGVSSHDRALTVLKLSDPTSKACDFVRPGHIFPLKARKNLIRDRRGHTEASLEMCKLASLRLASVISELVRDEDGLMMRLNDCIDFSKKHNIKLITIKQIVDYIS